MKFLFANTPQWYPISPYLSTALLAGQLKSAGFDADTYDFNVEFFNDILTTDYILSCVSSAKAFLDAPQSACSEKGDRLSGIMRDTFEMRRRLISDYFADGGYDKALEIARAVDDAVKAFKRPEIFYDPEQLFPAKGVINKALDIASLPFAPARIMLDNYIANPLMTFDYEDVRAQCTNGSLNMFLGYFEKKLAETNFSEYGFIGISVTDLSQLIPGLTLAMLLKKHTGAKICLGGNYIFKIEEDLRKIPEIFSLFCDYLSIGDGETAIVELAEYLDGKRSIGNVHSLVYMNGDGVVTANEPSPRLDMERIAFPDFSSFDFSRYFSPDTVLPVQLGKGCYWGKCTFCDFYTGQQEFDIKSVMRAADEVEYLAEKHSCKHFTFVDEAIPPKIYNELALEFIRRGLDINFYSFARLESGFTKEVLKNMHDAGCRFLMWGYEAHSERIMKLINKGIDVGRRLDILRDAREAGLWNHCTFLLCYPTETEQELAETIKVIYNRELVNSCTPSNFALKKNAILKDNASSVGITDFSENGNLHISYKYHALDKSMEDVKKARNSFEKKFLSDTADSLWSLTFTDSDHLLLYLSMFGRDKVFDYRLKNKKQ